jgi:hypothetical protein
LRKANKLLSPSHFNLNDANYTLLNGVPKGLQLSQFSPEKYYPGLFELLLAHKSKDSTDARDKVYALVGISSSEKIFGPLNYEWSEREVFIHTAQHIIRTTNTLNTICIRQNDDNKYNLPSWIPDWELRNKPPNHRIMGLHTHQPPFKASGESYPIYEFLENGDVFKVRGYFIDTIEQTSQPFHMNRDEQADGNIIQTLSAFQTWWAMYANNLSYRSYAIRAQEFSSTIYGGEWTPYSEPPSPGPKV